MRVCVCVCVCVCVFCGWRLSNKRVLVVDDIYFISVAGAYSVRVFGEGDTPFPLFVSRVRFHAGSPYHHFLQFWQARLQLLLHRKLGHRKLARCQQVVRLLG